MSIKFKKSKVEQIVREEFQLLMREFLEADDKTDDEEPSVHSADKDNDNVQPDKAGPNMAPKKGAEKKDNPEGDPPEVPAPGEEQKPEPGDEEVPEDEVPVGDPDPSDTELSQDVEAEPEPEEVEGGQISKEITGRSVQSVVMNPESKMMPGAKEIVIQFEEIPHPLRILLGKSGMVKFHFRGTIHNSL